MSYYAKHVFICTNQKDNGKKCCAQDGGSVFFRYMKEKLIALSAHGPNKIRLSQSGCLGRCHQGPCLLVYPEAVWYTYQSFSDLDEIIDEHLLNAKRVERLLLD
jgi:(2Fe-2S) ferredoxin